MFNYILKQKFSSENSEHELSKWEKHDDSWHFHLLFYVWVQHLLQYQLDTFVYL